MCVVLCVGLRPSEPHPPLHPRYHVCYSCPRTQETQPHRELPDSLAFAVLLPPSFAVFPKSETWELYNRSIHWTGLQTSAFRLAVVFYSGCLCLLQRDISLMSSKDYTYLWKVVFLSKEQLAFQYQKVIPEIISIDITLILRFIRLHLCIYAYVCICIYVCTNN